jgi:hypothetical protein
MTHSPRGSIDPDPEAVENWERLPQNTPSKSAFPPMTAGTRSALALLIMLLVLVILALVLGRPPA